MTDLERDADQELGATSGLGRYRQRAAEPCHSLAEAVQAEARPPAGSEHPVRAEPASVVLDAAEDLALRSPYVDRGPGSARMPADVVEGLLGGPVEGGLNLGREALLGPRHADGDPGTPRRALAQEAQRRHEPEVVEDHGAKLVREPPELVLRLAQHLHRLGQRLAALGGDVPSRTLQGKMHGGEELPCLVMELPGDPPRLLLAALVEASQRLVGLADAAVRHLEGRETFQHEALGALGEAAAVILAGLESRPRGAPQGQRQVEDADPLRERPAPELVGLVERPLVSGLEVPAQHADTAPLELALGAAHDL